MELLRAAGRSSAAPHGAPARSGRAPRHALLGAWLLALAACGALVTIAIGTRSGAPAAARVHHGTRGAGLSALAPGAREAISATLGAKLAGYRARPSARGFDLANPAQGMRASFSARGLQLDAGGTRIGLRVLALTQGSARLATGAAQPRAHANRVSFAHDGWSEWYSNGPLGLEQGFTIARAPARTADPLTVAMALSGDVRARLAPGAQVVSITRAGASGVQYGGLRATDSRGHALSSWLELRPGRLLLRVDARGARYPLRIDPLVQQGSKLTGSGASGAADIGRSVALSADGNTLLVGGPFDAAGVGAAWVFTRSGSTWTQQGGKLTGGGEIGAGQFGYAVALSADGNTALIGAGKDNSAVGAAWVFTRSGGVWTQQGGKLTGGGETGAAHFGCCAVALSGDGNTALIGGYADATNAGAAWVFTRSGSSWTQQGNKLTGSGAVGKAHFGYAVALSADASTALIGGGNDNSSVGAAWVFTRSGVSWTQQGSKLTGGGELGSAAFGLAVALDGKGETALVGGGADNGLTGAAWVFTRSGSSWSQQGAKLTGGEETLEGHFGCCGVALSESGDTAVVGGYLDNSGAGAAWAFTRSGSSWSQYGKKVTGSGEAGEALLGDSVAISKDGRTVAVGGDGDEKGLGAAWVFTVHNPPVASTEAASTLTPSSATLNGSVNPEGDNVTDCRFEYGTTEAYGSSVPCSSLPGSGTSPVAVSATLTGLAPLTVYHFRITATNATGTGRGADETFTTPAGQPPVLVTGEASSVAQTSATANATVNPNGEEVTDCHFDYGTSEAYGSSAPCSSAPGSGITPVAVSAALSGLSPSTTYHFRIVATNGTGTSSGEDGTFTTTASQPPAVLTGVASDVAQTTATLNATVAPEDEPVTDCHFEYGPTETYGASAPCSSLPGSGTSPVPVSAAISGLNSSTTYHFRIVAANNTGTSFGADATLTTTEGKPPAVLTGEASAITPTTATLNATVDPEDEPVSDCHFEYGPTEAYGSSAPCDSLPGSGTAPVAVSAAVGQLAPNTTYHFRIVATNPTGTSTGADRTLTTPLSPPTVVTEAASAIGQNSAALNATVNPNEGKVSDCHFEYGTSESYGANVACSTQPGSGTSPVAVTAAVAGLAEGTTYHFRIVATSPGGTSHGSDRTFTTATPTLPEVGRCVSLAKATGRYTSATCTTKSAGENTGKYEWRPWPATKNGFTMKSTTATTFESVKKVRVKCLAATSTGSFTSSQSAAVAITFTGCETTSAVTCQSETAKAGEISSDGLQGTLGFIKNTIVSGKPVVSVGISFKPASGQTLMAFTCGTAATSVNGAVISPISSGKMASTQQLKLKATNGKQVPEKFEGGVKETLLFATTGGEEQAGLTVTFTLTSEETLEIKALV